MIASYNYILVNRAVFNCVPKVIQNYFGFALLNYVVCLKNSHRLPTHLVTGVLDASYMYLPRVLIRIGSLRCLRFL